MIKVKGNLIEKPNIRDSFDRRAVKIQNHIVAVLKSLGVDRDSTDIPMSVNSRLKGSAQASWYFEGRNLKYSYSQMSNFIENLYVVDKVIENEVEKLINKEITLDQFQREFDDEKDLGDKLIEARKTLGVDEDEMDFEIISKKYKELARKYHPDMSGGDEAKFQEINSAHKLIRKELM